MGDILKVILSVLKKYWEVDEDTVRYFFYNYAWTPLIKLLKLIYPNKNETEIANISNEIYEELLNVKNEFFPWVDDLIKKLSQRYKLYLTTGNSTKVVEKALKEKWIYNCFQLVLWSDKFLKWEEHLLLFKENSEDDNFFKEAVYIWDGDSDREFAKMFWIDFVHIWNDKKDKYEIPSVIKLPQILDQIT
jgi:phosphoglycolate phosphatase-like HAD superfamily hydrolase